MPPPRLIELLLHQAQAWQEAQVMIASLRAEVAKPQARVAELEEQNRPPAGHPGAHATF